MKLEGACCCVKEYQGQPHLWSRRDITSESRDVPKTWIPGRSGMRDGLGWVPVEKGDKLSSLVNYDAGTAVVLRPSRTEEEVEEDLLEIALVPLADLLGKTLELIGHGIQKNPYNVGKSIRLLVPHGTLRLRNPPPQDFQQLRSWFTDSPEGRGEGIVWHCRNGDLFKLHRQHMQLSWPLDSGETWLGSRPVVVNVDGKLFPRQQKASKTRASEDLSTAFSKLNGQRFWRLQDVRIDS